MLWSERLRPIRRKCAKRSLRPHGRRAVAEWRSGQRLPPGICARAADENLTRSDSHVGDSDPGRDQRPAHRRHLRARQHRRHAYLRRREDRQLRPGRIRDDRDVYQFLSRHPVRHRSDRVACGVDAGLVCGRRPDPALPDPQGTRSKRHAADFPHLRAVAVAAEPGADAVHGKLPHGSHLLFRRSHPSRRALHPRRKTHRLCRRDDPERRALGFPAHHRSRQGDARRRAEPRRRDPDGHQPQPRVLRRSRDRAGAGGRRGFAADAVLFGLSVRRASLRADGLCRGGAGNAWKCHGRAGRKPDDGRRRVAWYSICRRRLRPDRGLCDVAADAGLQPERPRRREDAVVSKSGKWGVLAVAALTVAALALPLMVKSSFAIDIFIRILLFSFIGVAWNLMGGYAKQLSLGHAAYFGLGAYTSTILQVNFDISPWIGMVAGGVVAMLASLPIGWLCFRLKGPYFTIATIATAQALMLIFLKFRDFAWGAEGTTIPNLGNAPLMMQFEAKAAYYYVALGLLAIGLAITWAIEKSWMGYYLIAIGEDEDAAEAIGVNAPKIKRNTYMTSAFLTALAGTFYIQYIYFIDPPTAFSFNISIEAALVSIVGGIGTLWGPVIGTILLETASTLLQSWLGSSLGGLQLTVYALILMAVILWRPTGLIGMIGEFYQRHTNRWPASPRTVP